MRSILFFALTFGATVFAQDPLKAAGDYYFKHGDYKQAAALWEKVLKKEPKNLQALFRLTEIRLHSEGRAAVEKTLIRYLENNREISREARRKIKRRLVDLQELFLTDEGQSKYLQARARIRQKDCAGAVPILAEAERSEQGNLRVLRDKAACEKKLNLLDQYYLSLQRAFQSNPFDPSLIDQVSEAHLYFQKYGKVISLYTKGRQPHGDRQLVALGVALYESDRKERALKVVRQVVKKAASPIAYYVMGMSLWDDRSQRGLAKRYLTRFVKSVPDDHSTWDPFHLDEKREEVTSLMKGSEPTVS